VPSQPPFFIFIFPPLSSCLAVKSTSACRQGCDDAHVELRMLHRYGSRASTDTGGCLLLWTARRLSAFEIRTRQIARCASNMRMQRLDSRRVSGLVSGLGTAASVRVCVWCSACCIAARRVALDCIDTAQSPLCLRTVEGHGRSTVYTAVLTDVRRRNSPVSRVAPDIQIAGFRITGSAKFDRIRIFRDIPCIPNSRCLLFFLLSACVPIGGVFYCGVASKEPLLSNIVNCS
jgi:hypothetical protein